MAAGTTAAASGTQVHPVDVRGEAFGVLPQRGLLVRGERVRRRRGAGVGLVWQIALHFRDDAHRGAGSVADVELAIPEFVGGEKGWTFDSSE